MIRVHLKTRCESNKRFSLITLCYCLKRGRDEFSGGSSQMDLDLPTEFVDIQLAMFMRTNFWKVLHEYYFTLRFSVGYCFIGAEIWTN